MNAPNDREQKHLDYLLADFSATKAEIARRSTLQRVVLAAYVAALTVVFLQAASCALSSLWVVGIWVTSALALQFYAREGLEIARLSTVIRTRIASVASEIIGAPAERLLPSETNAEVLENHERRAAYNMQFNWALFFAVPTLVTLLFVTQHMDGLGKLLAFDTLTPWTALIVAAAAFRTFVLLRRGA